MSTLIAVQARMNSTRLPGKVLLPLLGQPMLARLVERLRRVTRADALVIATTTNAEDDAIVHLCEKLDVPYYRGSEQDVLARFAGAAREREAGVVVRITADCPLLDPALVDRMIEIHYGSDKDIVTNMRPPSWPYGMAVEVLSAEMLYEAESEADQESEREHVTPFFYWRPDRYRLGNLECDRKLDHYRLTVDTPEDYKLVRLIFESLHPVKPEFSLGDVLNLLDAHPEWIEINQHVEQIQVRPDSSTTLKQNP